MTRPKLGFRLTLIEVGVLVFLSLIVFFDFILPLINY